MLTPPDLSMRQIKAWVDGASLERGMRYFNDGAVFDGRREGLTIKGRCEGSQGGPYRVWARLKSAGGIEDAGCSCPVGGGGRCKHLAALLLTWQEFPQKFPEIASVDATLKAMNREQLVALVRQMIRQQPELEWLLRTPLPVPGEPSARATPEAYRRQAKGVFDRTGDEWGVESQIADGLRGVIEIGDDFAMLGQPENAAAVYEGVASEVLARQKRHEYEDEPGDLLEVIGSCADRAAELLPKLTDAAARERVLRFVFDVYRFDVESGGRDVLGDAYEQLLTATTPQERRTVAEWVRKELKKAKRDDWAAESLGGFLLDLEADTLDDETFLRVCRDTGRREDLVERLLKLRRVEEAAADLRQTENAYELAHLADLFVSAGHADVAERVVQERLRSKRGADDVNRESEQVTLLDWLKRRAVDGKDDAEALSLALRVYKLRPSREGYDEIKKLATKGGTWESTRPALLEELQKRGGGYRDVLARIHLDEGRVDDALAVVRSRGKPGAYGWGWVDTSSVELDVAKAAEKVRPDAAIEIYRERAERLVGGGSREYYRRACDYLKKLRKLHREMGRAAQWENYVADVRERNSKRRALREEMEKVGLWHPGGAAC
jgi:uncharacterized Zn finger protein